MYIMIPLVYTIGILDIYVNNYIWLVVSTPLKNMKVRWDDSSQYMENKINVPNHQSVIIYIYIDIGTNLKGMGK